MHIRLIEYLNAPFKGGTHFSKLVEYIAVNGGSLELTTIGAIADEGSVWGRKGLAPVEALDFVGIIQYIMGTMYGLGVDERAELFQKIQLEITRRETGGVIIIPTREEVLASTRKAPPRRG